MIEQLCAKVAWIERNLLPHERDIRHWLERKRLPESDIDDIIQEMYARIVAIENLDEIRAPKSYALQVARSIFLNQVRKPKLVTITKDGDLDDLGVASTEATPEDKFALKEEISEVLTVIAMLPERTRQVLLLRRVEGWSQRETAEHLGIAEKTVEKHLTRAAIVLMEHFGRGKKVLSRAFAEQHGSADDRENTTD